MGNDEAIEKLAKELDLQPWLPQQLSASWGGCLRQIDVYKRQLFVYDSIDNCYCSDVNDIAHGALKIGKVDRLVPVSYTHLIDGIPRDNMARVDPEDVESISVLKDASASIYGVRAANGV